MEYIDTILKRLMEAAGDDEPAAPEEAPVKEAPVEVPVEEPPAEDPTAGMGADIDPGMGDVGLGDMGLPGEVGPETQSEAGRLFELKRIHERLVSIESYLSASTDSNLIKLRNYVSKSLELFQLVSANYKLYKDKIDDIIILLYKFIDKIYDTLSKYYDSKSKGDK